MPLHDWSRQTGWEGVHHIWVTELLRYVKPQLPEGYRAYIGNAPTLAIGAPAGKPDVGVVRSKPSAMSLLNANSAAVDAPDVEVPVGTLEPATALLVEREGRLVAEIELVSPRNKDRRVARDTYTSRYCGYLADGIHLLLVDVHPRPREFSFADAIATEFGVDQPALAAPHAVAFRVGEPAATGGHFLAIWRRPMAAGDELPSIPLPLTLHVSVPVDLEATYRAAARDAYLD